MEIQVARKGETVTLQVDQETLDELNGRKITMSGNGYAQVTVDGRTQSLHRWILGLGLGDRRVADHINRDKLDNRKVNLRVVTPTGSNMNRVVRHSPLGRGVSLRRSGRYGAKLKRHGVPFELGTYDTKEQAAMAVLRFEDGPMTALRAWEFRQAAEHTHSEAGRLKCRKCNP